MKNKLLAFILGIFITISFAMVVPTKKVVAKELHENDVVTEVLKYSEEGYEVKSLTSFDKQNAILIMQKD